MPSILITGVSTGIGRACAELMLSKGWTVIGTVRDVTAPAAGPVGISLEPLDLSVPGDGERCGRAVVERYGCPDVLLNNAGVVQFGAIEDLSAADLARIYQVNVFGQIELVRALVPSMRERRSGTIANVTSLGGRIVFPFFAGYNSTKWAMEALSEGLWHELKPFGIRVKAIEPGYVATAIWGKAIPEKGEPVAGSPAYRPYMEAMRSFEAGITDRTSSEDAAEEIAKALLDSSDRLRYPVAAYARPITAARRGVGDQALMHFFHSRWMGHDAG